MWLMTSQALRLCCILWTKIKQRRLSASCQRSCLVLMVCASKCATRASAGAPTNSGLPSPAQRQEAFERALEMHPDHIPSLTGNDTSLHLAPRLALGALPPPPPPPLLPPSLNLPVAISVRFSCCALVQRLLSLRPLSVPQTLPLPLSPGPPHPTPMSSNSKNYLLHYRVCFLALPVRF